MDVKCLRGHVVPLGKWVFEWDQVRGEVFLVIQCDECGETFRVVIGRRVI